MDNLQQSHQVTTDDAAIKNNGIWHFQISHFCVLF